MYVLSLSVILFGALGGLGVVSVAFCWESSLIFLFLEIYMNRHIYDSFCYENDYFCHDSYEEESGPSVQLKIRLVTLVHVGYFMWLWLFMDIFYFIFCTWTNVVEFMTVVCHSKLELFYVLEWDDIMTGLKPFALVLCVNSPRSKYCLGNIWFYGCTYRIRSNYRTYPYIHSQEIS